MFTSGREVDTVGVWACVRESVLNESGSDGLWDGGSNCGAGGAAQPPSRFQGKQVGRHRKAGCQELGEMAENRGDELAIRNEDGHLKVAATQKNGSKPTPRKRVSIEERIYNDREPG